MQPTHYEVLGVAETASADEIRRAYRRLVLRYHPDRNRSTDAAHRFHQVAQSYQVLSDPERRANYDAMLRLQRSRKEPGRTTTEHTAAGAAGSSRRPSARSRTADIANTLGEAARYFAQGKYGLAESAARRVLQLSPKEAMAHAILGDIASIQQRMDSALKHYAFAMQLDPNNENFRRRYEQIFRQVGKVGDHGRAEHQRSGGRAIAVAGIITGLSLLYLMVAREAPLGTGLMMISTWTQGLMGLMFITGAGVGVALSLTHSVDTFQSVVRGSSGRPSLGLFWIILGFIAFWVATFVYFVAGVLRNSFSYSVSRAFGITAGLALSFTVAAYISPTILPMQTLLWSGNLLLFAVVCGWVVADCFR